MATVRAEHLYKIFGRRPESAVRRLEEGASREEIRTEGYTPAVIDASFEVKEGETFVVMGLSGSGKSTLIRMLNGLLIPTAGRVLIDDDDVTRLSPKQLRALRARKASMVFQHFALFPHRTVLDNVGYGLQVRREAKQERDRRAREALTLVGLQGWEDSYPVQLSGGMQQRVGLARALATDPEILLMDEAFSALDPLIRREMQDQLIELQQRLHKTVVFITHDLNEAMKLGDRIAMMRDGRIVQIGTAEDILNDPANDYVAAFIQDVDRSRVLTANSIMVQPAAVARSGEGPRALMRTMRAHQVSALFVVDRGRRLAGTVTDQLVARALRDGAQLTAGDLATDEAVTIGPNTPIAEMFAPAAESPLPLAVVDGEGQLLGVIPRVTLLAALSGGEVESAEGHGSVAEQPSERTPALVESATGHADEDQQGHDAEREV